MSTKPIKENATFKIKNGDVVVSFKVVGSTVAALVEAFTWLTPERRLKVLERMQAKQTELLAKEAERAGACSMTPAASTQAIAAPGVAFTQDGPWIDAGLSGDNPKIIGGPLRLIKCEGVVIAFLPAWLDDEADEARANARLIKTAPTLLAALQALAFEYDRDTPAYRAALEAIAEATS